MIPAGTGHLFTKIDDHIDYLMVRIDPDKVTPIRDEAASKAYLAKPARPRSVTPPNATVCVDNGWSFKVNPPRVTGRSEVETRVSR